MLEGPYGDCQPTGIPSLLGTDPWGLPFILRSHHIPVKSVRLVRLYQVMPEEEFQVVRPDLETEPQMEGGCALYCSECLTLRGRI